MANFAETYDRNHRQQQRLLAGLAGLALLFSFAPRQERALFILPDASARAFAASVPPASNSVLPDDLFSLIAQPARRAFFARTPRRAGTVGPTSPFSNFSPAGAAPGAVGAGSGPALADAAPVGSPDTGAGGGTSPGGAPFPFSPTGLTTPSTSPVGLTATPATPTTPANPATPVVPTTPNPVIPGVPEPGAWAMMITGFMLVGMALRRRRGRGAQAARRAA